MKMNPQGSVYQPQMIIPTPVQPPYAAPAAPFLQQYVITDASGQQVIVTGTAQSVGQAQGVGQPVVQAGPAPTVQAVAAALAPGGPVVPVWMVRVAIGALILGAGGLGAQFLAGALDHLVHALGELIRLLVTLLVVLGGGAVGLWVLKGVMSSGAKPGAGAQGGVVQSVTTNVAVSLSNQIATGRRGRNNA
ncbi:hypothetical protein ACFWXO_36830 [Kitasatospora sp. NPDC059088]|uniref:hypothetical protein n=1 Tax=Kitasatospora sp. NPDC059088 TaxID=3346722 RepID=UPI00367B4A8A